VISKQQPEWVPVFTGLTVRRFDKLVRVVATRGGERAWISDLEVVRLSAVVSRDALSLVWVVQPDYG
jgi:hypothetical protein